jgi:RNA polymerase sigma factor for flagellar operon FliA
MKVLVKKYKQETQHIDSKLRDQLIVDYAPLIRFVAQKIASRLPPNIDIDDLISSGVIGLMDAIEKYDPSRDNKFKTYAEFRIRGSILDELRSQDWIPRSVRDKAKRLDKVYIELEKKHGRPATDLEIAEALVMPLHEYHEMVSRIKSITLLSIDDLNVPFQGEKRSLMDFLENTSVKNPFSYLRNKNIKNILIESIENLPEKQRLVLSLYYYEDLNLKEIGRILDVTESRVSQLHTQAVEKLRSKLKDVLLD